MDRDVYGTNLKRHRGGDPDEKWFHHVASRRDVYKLPPVYTHLACSRHGETIFHRDHPLCAASDSYRKHRDPSGEKRILETHLYITTAFFLTQDATVHQRSQRPANR